MFETAWTTESYEQECQDRVAVFSDTGRTVIVVADDAGGTGLGGHAAKAIGMAFAGRLNFSQATARTTGQVDNKVTKQRGPVSLTTGVLAMR